MLNPRNPGSTATAQFVAALRALYADAPFPMDGARDRVAAELLPRPLGPAVQRLTRLLARRPSLYRALSKVTFGLSDNMALRSLRLDEAVRQGVEHGIRQLVILGAGLDARAYRLPELAEVSVYELDSAASQRTKQRDLARHARYARRTIFVAVDFEHGCFADALLESGFDASQPSLWLWEGVTMYLSREARQQTLQTIGRLSAPGSSIAITYLRPEDMRTPVRRAFCRIGDLFGEAVIGLVDGPTLHGELEAAGFAGLDDSGGSDWARRYWPGRQAAEAWEHIVVASRRAPHTAELDILSPDLYREGIPHARFERLRREAPVYWHAEPDGPGFWAVVRHADVVRVSRDQATFSSAQGGAYIKNFPTNDPRGSPLLLLNMTGATHASYRALLNKAFVPRVIHRAETRVRQLITQMIDDVAERGECEFVQELAGNLPLLAILEILGIPTEDRQRVLDLSNRIVATDDPDFQLTHDDFMKLYFDTILYVNELAEQKRRNPGNDLLSLLIAAERDGMKLDPLELAMLFGVLMSAGHETTRNLIAGGMLALLEHPAELQRLRADPSLLPTAIEEMLRFVSPVIHFRRTATRATTLAGQSIAAGDKVVVWYSSANRDETVFPDPHRFDVGRAPNEHVAFGMGPHFCIGSTLARLEARIVFEELLRRLPDLQLAGPVVRLRSNFINGIKRMPVRFSAAPRLEPSA